MDTVVFHNGKLGRFKGCATVVDLQETLQVLEITWTLLQIKSERVN